MNPPCASVTMPCSRRGGYDAEVILIGMLKCRAYQTQACLAGIELIKSFLL